jgi:hypothetical protein
MKNKLKSKDPANSRLRKILPLRNGGASSNFAPTLGANISVGTNFTVGGNFYVGANFALKNRDRCYDF